MKSKFLIFTFIIILLVACSGNRNNITREKAFKAITLTMTNKKNLLKDNENIAGIEDIDAKVYVDYLLKNKIIDEKLSKKNMEGFLTFEELKLIYSKLPQNEEMENLYKKYRGSEYVDLSSFYRFLVYFNSSYEKAGQAKEIDSIIYEVEKYKKNIDKVNTSDKNTYYADDGLNLYRYRDKKLKLLVLDDEIFYLEELISDEIEYNNVLISNIKGDKLEALVLNSKREFKISKNVKDLEKKGGIIADIRLKASVVQSMDVKSTKISGRVLSVDNTAIEIEGHGRFLLAKEFTSFNRDSMSRESLGKIIVGTDTHEFYIDNENTIAAAIKVRDYDYSRVRVLIMNDFFKVRHHNTITLNSEVGLIVRKDNADINIPANQDYSLTKENLKDNERISIRSADDNVEIKVKSLKRDIGVPSYKGYLEIVKKENSIYLINDISIDEYLKKVVPSEMPSNFELEALKAQAVVARTYTCRTIASGGELRVFGANLDDSINYQVYANKNTSENTDRAVEETKGMRVLYKGEFAQTFYYSTSAGVSTDGTIWGASEEEIPYLKSYSISKDKKVLNITTNSSFKKFIDEVDEKAYEKNYDFYRWEVNTTNKILNDKITKVGNVLAINITKRGEGGIVKEIEVVGEDGKYKIKGHNSVRAALGSNLINVIKNNGEKVGKFSSLPSSFFYIETKEPDENNIINFKIKGGGYGHGVGMSQNAANEMAHSGMKYTDIIKFFYEDTDIK
jgi:spoIID/lytB domain protein